MTTMTNEEILEAVGDMTVYEFVDFIEAFKAKFGVEVAAPGVAVEDAPAPTPVVEQEYFTVVLVAAGPKKIEAIKTMREVTGLGLKEAKTATETAEYVVKADLSRADAEAIRDRFVAVEAVAVIR